MRSCLASVLVALPWLMACPPAEAPGDAAGPPVEAPAPAEAPSGVMGQPATARSAVVAQVVEGAQDWTTGPQRAEHPQDGPATLGAVRVARHEGYDRVVFEFAGGLPGWRTRYVDGPVECASGLPVEVAGEAHLEVRMELTQAHDEAGQVTIEALERTPELPAVRELELTCDFEAVVVWVLGVRAKSPYQVRELPDPPRLVVDVRHGPR